MNRRTRVLPPEILLEEYRRLLETEREIEALPLIISGSSMTPFLADGRDTVYLSRLERPVRRGDVLLYRRESGTYVLHRVYAVEGACYTMVGDGQTELEPGIRQEQVIAIMTSALRKGKRQEPGCFWWEFFEKIWIRMVPARGAVRSGYLALKRLLGFGR